jgi:hypothetical protein
MDATTFVDSFRDGTAMAALIEAVVDCSLLSVCGLALPYPHPATLSEMAENWDACFDSLSEFGVQVSGASSSGAYPGFGALWCVFRLFSSRAARMTHITSAASCAALIIGSEELLLKLLWGLVSRGVLGAGGDDGVAVRASRCCNWRAGDGAPSLATALL